ANSQYLTRILRRQVAAAIIFQTKATLSPGCPIQLRPNRVAVAMDSFQLQPQPIVPAGSIVLQQQRSGTVIADQYIQGAIVIVVSQRQAACREKLLERWATSFADIMKLVIIFLIEQQQGLFVSNLRRIAFDHVVGMSIGQQ